MWCEIASRVLAHGQNVLAHGHNVLAHRRHACTQAQCTAFAQCAPLQNDHVQHRGLYTWLYTFVTLHLLHLACAEWFGGSAGCGLDTQVPRLTGLGTVTSFGHPTAFFRASKSLSLHGSIYHHSPPFQETH